jgi:hypothetical protein
MCLYSPFRVLLSRLKPCHAGLINARKIKERNQLIVCYRVWCSKLFVGPLFRQSNLGNAQVATADFNNFSCCSRDSLSCGDNSEAIAFSKLCLRNDSST